MMEKAKMHSPNLVEANISKLMELFPNCITESIDQNGNLKKSVDFNLLRQELSDSIIEGAQERYRLDWPGKREALLTANAPIAKTLRPCQEESVDFDTTENLFIEGDNLEALKLLQETYLGKVKMIYIDPPYNTGKDFIYADNFAESTEAYLLESGQKDEEGNRLVANSESNGRFHSDWLSMMYPRLKLARNLLKDDGVIFISIDDNEVHNLRKICDEIFGAENFISTFIWKSRQNKDNRNETMVSIDHEYVLCYGLSIRGSERNKEQYSNPDNDPRGDWTSANMVGLATKNRRPNLHYDLVNPKTNVIYDCPRMGWRYDKNTMSRLIKEDYILWPKTVNGRPRKKAFYKDLSSSYTGYSSIIGDDIFTRNGTLDIDQLFGFRAMDFPKPKDLIKDLIDQATEPNDIILDFYSGSATTAHAVMQLNADDSAGSSTEKEGKRKFIMVQLPEACDEKSEAFKAGYKTIAEISKERIRRAGRKIKEENPTTTSTLDIGFRVLKIDSSNMADVYYSPDKLEQGILSHIADNVREDRTREDLLFQVLLDWGVDLSLPIRKETISENDVFFVDNNALAACFVKNGEITETFCKELAKREPLRVVFRDAGFKDDNAKINVEQIFKLVSPHTEIKTI